jgi:acetyl-CoA acetyltransferase
MNNLYVQERLVELKQREVQQEVEQARLAREAGVSGESLLARAVKVLRKALQAWKGGSQDPIVMETKTYPSNESV